MGRSTTDSDLETTIVSALRQADELGFHDVAAALDCALVRLTGSGCTPVSLDAFFSDPLEMPVRSHP